MNRDASAFPLCLFAPSASAGDYTDSTRCEGHTTLCAKGMGHPRNACGVTGTPERNRGIVIRPIGVESTSEHTP